jgi:zinc protease
VLGYPDRFKKVTRDEVFAYYQQRYSPQMSTFIAVGDFEAARVMPEMAKELSTWQRKSVEQPAIPEEPEQVAPRRVDMTHPLCEVPKLIMGFPTVSIRDADLYALDVLASIAGDGRASRLYQSVKDQQNLVYEISAFNYTPQYKGYFGITAQTDDDKLAAAQAAIVKVLEEAKTKKPTDEELARAKRKVYTQHIMAKMTAEGLAGNLGSDWFTAGDMDFSETYSQHIQEVSADEVLRVAKKYLVAQKLSTAIMRPAPKPDAAAKAAKGDHAAEEAAHLKALNGELAALKARPEVKDANLLADKSVFEFGMKESGIRVVVKEDASLPVVSISLAGLGGTRWEPAELAGAANLMADMLDRGTQKRSKLQLAEETEAIGAQLSGFSGRNSFGVNVTGLSQDLPKLIDLASDCLLHPKFDAGELDKLKGETLQQIAQEDESIGTLNQKILRPLLYGNHPYARQVLGTAETVTKVTSDDLKKMHEAWVQPENIAVSFAGDITALKALDQALAHFGQLKPGKFKAPPVPAVPEIAEAKKGEGEKANITGAVLTIGFRGVNLKSPDREPLDLMSSVLSGLGGRLFQAFREKEGLSYSVGASNDAQLDGGAFVFFVQTDAKSLEKSVTKMFAEVKRLREELIDQKELDSIKSYLAGTEAIELQDQAALAQRLALAQLYEEGAQHVFSRKARLEKLTPEQVQAVAKKFLDPQRYAQAILKPKNDKHADNVK